MSFKWLTLRDLADEAVCRNPLRINCWRWSDVPRPADHIQGHAVTAWHGEVFYTDTGESVDWDDLRPCAHCGLPRSPERHDGCIANLPDVVFACCGHGVEPAELSYGEPSENGDGPEYFRFSPVPIDHPARGRQ
jgi:hypothetical protein